MRVTIISDASFCPNTKAAGYGGWVVCNRGNNANGGPLRGAPDKLSEILYAFQFPLGWIDRPLMWLSFIWNDFQ